MRKILEIGKILLKDLNLAIIKKQALIKNLEISNKTEHVNYLNRSVDHINNVSIQKDKININSNLRERIKEKNILLNKQLFSSSLERTDNLEKDKLDTVPLLIQSLIRRKKLLSEETTSIEQGAYGSYLYGRFKEIAKNNQINIEESIKNISNNTSFLNKKDSSTRSSAPVSLFYYSNNLSASTTSSAISNKMEDQGSQASQDNLLVNIDSKPILNLYLKEMSTYNMVSKGIFINFSNIIGFNFNKGANKLYKNIYKLLASSFKSMYCLISKPVFIITPEKVIIQLFYFLFIPNILKLKKIYKYKNERANKKMFKGREWFNRKKKLKKQYSKFRKIKLNVRIKLRNLSNITLTKIFSNKFKFLSLILNKFFKKPIEFDLIRLHYPYNDSNILVNLLGIMINKIKLRIIIRRLFERAVIKNLNKLSGNNVNIIPAFLSGITIRVAGRLLTHRVVPRQTVKTTRRGASAKGKINFKDIATYTNKNKRGAFSITVKSGQNFF
uniref:Small ribosomal subunit protein uS3m n=1 Tax=Lyophyllum shimeji TaxID=47721 RepID=A0A2Z4HGZ4_LYOSH|nr:ribosomal protein S3 [Lyophyllum shimeji]AWW14106.1 ribosomal protein S3 [Lyophyllum shimeji]